MTKFKKWNELTEVNSYLCRLCLSLDELLVPIFEGEGKQQELFDKIQKYLPIKISSSDTLPQQICFPCAETLIAWNSLYKACVSTEKKLESVLNATNSSKFCSKVNLDNEPLIQPKKRKPSMNAEGEESNVLFKYEKVKNKLVTTKKVKKAYNSEDVKDNFKEDNLDNFSENALTIEIKTECESEDECCNNGEISGENGSAESSLIKCEFCKKFYKDKKSLLKHVKNYHDAAKSSAAQKCEQCNNVYKSRANLERHFLKEHLTNQVSCPVCRISLNSKKLDLHLRTIHGVKTDADKEEKFKCKFCEKWFKNKYVRNSHVKEVHLSEPMKCKLCDFEGVRTVLRRHKRDVHAEKKFLCNLCPGAFKTLHTLKMHMTSHSDIRCYTCDVCGMGFKRLNNVRDHMKCHEQKSNQCQICGNFFARKRYLAIHEKTIHNFYADGVIPEEKGFECGICGAKLKWKKNLLAHMRIHTGEKPYVCKICNKDFICHGSLRTHMAKHSVCVPNETDAHNIFNGTVEINVFNNFSNEQV